MSTYLDLAAKGVRSEDAITAQWFSVAGTLQPLVWDVLRELEPCHICHIKWAYLKENFLPYNEKAGYMYMAASGRGYHPLNQPALAASGSRFRIHGGISAGAAATPPSAAAAGGGWDLK